MYTLYGTRKWKKRRMHQLKIEPLCRTCLAEGKVVVAKVADHVRPWRPDGVNAFWLGELQSLCRNCHESKKKYAEKHGFDRTVGSDGLPLDKRHPVYTGKV